MKAKYINPYTDYGFKKIFGEEVSKPLLIDFLNSLLPAKDLVEDLTFKNAEQLGPTEHARKAVFDIYCQNNKGEKFIVELQKAKQDYFKERTIYYSTFPIREQAEKGEWNYNLKAVYCIGILDFTFDEYQTDPDKGGVVHTIKLKNEKGNVFYEKLTYIYLEMPNFKKGPDELSTRLDQWLYFIKNLEDFQTIPAIFKDEVFTQAFETAALAKMGPEEMDRYEESLKVFRDNKAVIDYAKTEGKTEGKIEGIIEGKIEGKKEGIIEGKIEGKKEGIIEGKIEGKKEGIIEGKLETAGKLLEEGVSIEKIIRYTGLTREAIEELQKKN